MATYQPGRGQAEPANWVLVDGRRWVVVSYYLPTPDARNFLRAGKKMWELETEAVKSAQDRARRKAQQAGRP